MHIPKISLVLILITLLTAACSPSALARQASSPSLATTGDMAQLLQVTATPAIISSQPKESPLTKSEAIQSGGSESEFNPESSFPLAPGTEFAAGNGGGEEVESSGAFLLQSQDSAETVSAYYQSALPSVGWKLRYTDANHAGGVTQYWKHGLFYMSLDFAYDDSGLAIQVLWHQVNLEHAQMLPDGIALPPQADIVDATDSTWQVFIPQQVDAASEYFREEAAALDWTLVSLPTTSITSNSGDSAHLAAPSYPPQVTPMPSPTPDSRLSEALAYTLGDGNQVNLQFHPQQDGTILDITLTLKNVASAGLPRELPIYPGATGMVIAPGLLRFNVPVDIRTVVEFYVKALAGSGWTPSAGYSLDTPELYYQVWDKGDQSLRFNISSPASSSQSSLVSIQCLQCSAP